MMIKIRARLAEVRSWLAIVWDMPNKVWEMQGKLDFYENKLSEMSRALIEAHAKISYLEDDMRQYKERDKWLVDSRLQYLESTQIGIYVPKE